MDLFDHFRDRELAGRLAARLKAMKPPPVRFMEVCGTHTVAIARNSIRELLPEAITLTSGPGCPVCVTSTADIDRFIAAASLKNSIITTFGDLIKVPGSTSSLQQEMTNGRDVRMVYSPLDALHIARQNPEREVIFLGVGFETTTPTVAATIIQASREKLSNFSVLTSHKVMPPALEALMGDPEIKISGLLCPGHVSIIIGADSYQPLVDRYALPCVIAGFEPLDILQGIVLLTAQIIAARPQVEIAYQRAVTRTGNRQAQEIMHTVFEPADAEWRGLGVIPASGLAIRPTYQEFDSSYRFELPAAAAQTPDPAGCQCGKVLKGIITPRQCKLFGSACRPDRPIGPCMVSSEGSCAAFFHYGLKLDGLSKSP